MIEIICSNRWSKTTLSSIFVENIKKNIKLSKTNALQFYFGTLIPKKRYELTEDLIKVYKKYTVVIPGDIMLNGLNLNYDFISQRVAIVKEQGIITSAYISLRSRNDEKVNNDYYCYLFKAMDDQKMFHGMGTGIRLTLSYADLKNLKLPFPPRSEQDQIVRFLDWKISSINRLTKHYKQEIDVLNEMKNTLIDEAVIKGLRKARYLHNDDIRWDIDYPSHWKMQRIREVFSFRKGLSITKANLEETGFAVISYGQVHSKKNSGVELNKELIRYVNESYLTSNPNSIVEKGDFIFADTSEDLEGCGNCAYIDWEETIFAGYHSIIAHPKNCGENKYLAYLFKSPTWRYQIRKKVNAVKVYSITQKILKDVFILLPPLNEQIEIVKHLDNVCTKIDALIAKMEDKIHNLNYYKISLTSAVVTGKMDIRNIRIPEYEYVSEESVEGDSDNDDELTKEQED